MSIIPRLNRLLANDGRCFDVAIDHSFFNEPFYCITPQETARSHRILTAALESNRWEQVVQLESSGEQ